MKYARFWSPILTVSLITLAAGATATAAGPAMSFGGRAGLSVNPDQFVIGLQGSWGNAAGPLDFAPSFDMGFGDNNTSYVFNADFQLPFSLPRSSARLYAGAGPTLAVFDHNNHTSNSELGLSLVGGVMLPMGATNAYNLEFRAGVGDIPDIRVLLGIAFGGGRR